MRRSTYDMDVVPQQPGGLSSDLLALLRHRLAIRFYDNARVIDDIARAIVRLPVHFM